MHAYMFYSSIARCTDCHGILAVHVYTQTGTQVDPSAPALQQFRLYPAFLRSHDEFDLRQAACTDDLALGLESYAYD